MTKDNQYKLLAAGLIIVSIGIIISKKKNDSNKTKVARPKSSYSDLLKTSAPILTPFAKLAAEKIAQRIL